LSEEAWIRHLDEKLLDTGHNADGSPHIEENLQNDSRINHGKDHATGVAIFTVIFAYLYEKYLQAEPSPQDTLMMLLSAAFHDSGRQAEGIDIDEKRSATNAQTMLTQWKVPEREVAICYDAILNKDRDWQKKSLVAKCVQCADSMAYSRLGNWDKTYSDLFKE